MTQGKQAGDKMTRGGGGGHKMSGWQTTRGNTAMSYVRRYVGGQQDKRRGVEDMTQGNLAVDNTMR
jgi:hypothetical protein